MSTDLSLSFADRFGGKYTPLHYASYNGHVDVVRILLNYGAHINAKNEAECTALFLASQQGKCHVVQVRHMHAYYPLMMDADAAGA